MSNKSRLQTNNTNLQALISKANALPDAGGGSGGGGSVETCTVIINHPYSSRGDFISSYFIPTHVDGNYSSSFNFPTTDETVTETSFTINNVVCGTHLYIESVIDSNIYGYSFDKAELIRRSICDFVIKITANAGETATINIYDDD